MRLAILGSRGFPSSYGGYETLVRHLAPYLAEQGHDVTVYCRTREAGSRSWRSEGVRCIYTPGIESKSLSTLTFGLTAMLHAGFERYDGLLMLNIANGLYLPMFKRLGVPVVANTDGVEWERGKWGRVARRVFRIAARMTAKHADSLVADSEAIQQVWSRLFGADSTFIPYGAPVLDDVDDARVRALGLASERYALVVSRLCPENNLGLILDALSARLDGRRPLVIVGAANYRSDLKRRLMHASESSNIRWLGHVDDQELLTQLWAHAGVYVHGHSVGGTNPALLQALGVGAPTLALDTPYNREVLERDEQLFPHDADDLGRRVVTLLEDPDQRRQMRRHGREVVHERYRWDAVCQAYESSLRRLVEAPEPVLDLRVMANSAEATTL